MVQSGLEFLLSGSSGVRLSGRRVGLIANPTAVNSELNHAADLLHAQYGLKALFGPEHGIRGAAQDMIGVGEAIDDTTGVPVYSLYGSNVESLSPTPESLEDIDVLVFDIQDIGSRYYTYVWTMVLAMRACAQAKVEFVVLDRPNPIGGTQVEGGAIAQGFDSFVGLRSLPNRHGLSAGEIALWAKDEEGLDLELHVVPCQGWRRSMYFRDTGLPWVLPSPNMPTVDTALVYPGMCLVEGTEISEGRGHTRPFEIVGAPFIQPDLLVRELDRLALPGVVFRPLHFLPTFHKCGGEVCGGIQQHVTDTKAYKPYATGLAFLWATQKLWPELFAWRTKAYEFVEEIPAIDLLTGNAAFRLAVEAGADFPEIVAEYQREEALFCEYRKNWLLYS